MATTITGKLNQAATQFAAGESTGFGVRLGVKFYDRETKSDQWCNYQAVLFAKAPAQVAFYQQVLVEGAIIEISGDKQRIKQFQGQNGLMLSIEILDAKLGAAYAPQQAPAPAAQQQRPQQAPAAQPQIGYRSGAATPNNYNPAPAQQQPFNQAPAQQHFHNPNVAMMNGQPQSIEFDDDIPF